MARRDYIENPGSEPQRDDKGKFPDQTRARAFSEPGSKTAEEFFTVLQLTQADLKHVFKGNATALARIKRMAPDEMDYLAEKFGDALMNTYWDTLQIVFEERFLREARK